jgi:hypothetical protein
VPDHSGHTESRSALKEKSFVLLSRHQNKLHSIDYDGKILAQSVPLRRQAIHQVPHEKLLHRMRGEVGYLLNAFCHEATGVLRMYIGHRGTSEAEE